MRFHPFFVATAEVNIDRYSCLSTTSSPGIGPSDESVVLFGGYYSSGREAKWKVTLTWRDIFSSISPYLIQLPTAAFVKSVAKQFAFARWPSSSGTSVDLDDQIFQTVSVQMRAPGLVEVRYLDTVQGGMGLFWSATPAGERLMLELRTVKSKP